MKLSSLSDIKLFEQRSPQERSWPTSTYATLVRAAEEFGDRPAVSAIANVDTLEVAESLSFAQLLEQVHRMANLLAEDGVGPDGITAYFLPNLLTTQVVLWGAEAAGIAFPINTMLSAHHVAALLREAGARVLVTAPTCPAIGWGGWDELRPHLQQCAALSHVYLARCDEVPVRAGHGAAGEAFTVAELEPALARQPADRLISGRIFLPDDPSSYFCTGGTTGMPKLAVRTHGAEAANPQMLASMLGEGLEHSARLMLGLPLFHVNAAVTSLTTWIAGGEVLLVPGGFRNKSVLDCFWRIVERYRISFFSAVPTILGDLLDRPIDADVASLRFVICGAAPLSVELFNRFEATTGLRILEGYGLTESTCVASINPFDGERRIGSVGMRLPFESIRCIQRTDAGTYLRDCEPDEGGAIVIAGPNIFRGYTDPFHDQSVWVDLGDGLRWLDTGDLGRIDQDGYVWLLGRKKELIIRGGHNIDPLQIEEALYSHPAVKLAAAIGRPDRRLGEVPVAYVELLEGAEASAAALQSFAVTRIADRAALPKEVIVLPAMPVTPVGKISKVALVQREVLAIARHEAESLDLRLEHLSAEMRKEGPVILLSGEAAPILMERLAEFAIASVIEIGPEANGQPT